MYGTNWCQFTFGLREYLMDARIDYEYFDIDSDSRADEFVRTTNNGKRKHPMIVVAQRIVVNPTLDELQQLLEDQDVVARPRTGRHSRRTGARRDSRSAL